jgi:cell division protein FtsL
MLKYTLLILQLIASLWLGILFLFFPEKVSDLIIMLFSLTFFFRIPSIILSIRIHSLDRLIASIKKEIDEKSKILEDLKSKTNEKRTE